MAVETELKLRIAPEHLARLKRHPLLKSGAQAGVRHLYNVYFDTPKLDLHHARMALRLRRAGKQWLQTLKGGGELKGGLHSRNEWEIPVAGEALEFPDAPEWDEHLPQRLRKKLKPVFTTDFRRTMRTLDWHGAVIELCIDQGEIRTEQHSLPICELELELKSGEASALFELALAILDIAPCELEPVNKAEYGFRLLEGRGEAPVKAAMLGIADDETLPGLLQKTVWACLQHLQVNLRGAMRNDDPEYLHQVRVALRRLRVALRIAEKLRADGELAALRREVAALCIELGRIREWDVFIDGTLLPMRDRMPGDVDLQALVAVSERRRGDCYDTLHGQSGELQRLMLRLSLWMNGPYWEAWETGEPLREFASSHLGRLARRYARATSKLAPGEAERLHALRICAKKLRYSAEFFAGLYGGRRTGGYLEALTGVQDVLGIVNDATVAHRLLEELSTAKELSSHRASIPLAKGWVAHGLARQFGPLKKALRRFEERKAFWKG